MTEPTTVAGTILGPDYRHKDAVRITYPDGTVTVLRAGTTNPLRRVVAEWQICTFEPCDPATLLPV
jgi:hypothetical protein